MSSVGAPEIVFVLLIVTLIIVPFAMIFDKAGFSKWLSLLMIIPLVNYVVLYAVAFSQWKPRV